MKKLKIGFIPAHRDLMDEQFAQITRDIINKKLKDNPNIEVLSPDTDLTKGGLVRNHNDSLKVKDFFAQYNLDAVIIGMVTFGDEKSIFSIVENYNNMPIFLFGVAEPEIPQNSFFKSAAACGILPVSFGLKRRKIEFTFGGIINDFNKEFSDKINSFLSVVQALKKFKNARIGMIGPRPNDFEVCAVNEALMISKFRQKIIHINLLDLKYDMEAIKEDSADILKIINEISYGADCAYTANKLINVARLEYQLQKYIQDYDLDALTIQCWTTIQKHIGVTPCMTNSRLTQKGYPVGCEGDVNNTLAMLIQGNISMGSSTPMLLDMLALHPTKKNLMLAWHCGNVSSCNISNGEIAKIRPQSPWENVFGKEKAAASIEFVVKSGPVMVNSLVEHQGNYKLLSFRAEFVKSVESVDSIRGAWSWMKLENRDHVYEKMVNEGFTHHLSIIHGDFTDQIREFCKYTDIELIEVG